MPEIKQMVEIALPVTPEDVAKMFCEMDSEQQAIFFNAIAKEVENWGRDFAFQLSYVDSEPGLADDGRRIMKAIGDYSGL